MAGILISALGRPYMLPGTEKMFKKIKVTIKKAKYFLKQEINFLLQRDRDFYINDEIIKSRKNKII